MTAGKVTLVGAGCGKGLITVAGMKAIREAEVILYDDLIDTDLLLDTKEGCEYIYVGKRYGRESIRQDHILAIMIEKAEEGKNVVRLKGGDSFVFGRGGEEVLALQEAGIPYDVIPGVSSAIAVPEEMGIPVTHRQVSRSFTVVTGHTADGSGESFEALAHLKGTLVFLMGLNAAGTIADELMKNGKSPETKASVLSKGFSRGETRLDCTLASLGETAKQAESPAILVVGDVAGFHMEKSIVAPLHGVRVEVTGTEHFTELMQTKLLQMGAEVVRTPCLRIHPTLENVPETFAPYKWLAFTSANGVHLFFDEMKMRHMDLRAFAGKKFAVIGDGTARALNEHGIFADFVPSVYTSCVFGKELGDLLHGKEESVLILRAKEGSPELTRKLQDAGVTFSDIAIYETGTFAGGEIEKRTQKESCDYITFSSAAGVRAYMREHVMDEHAMPVCIGPATAGQFEKLSDRHYLMPDIHTADGMAEIIQNDVKEKM